MPSFTEIKPKTLSPGIGLQHVAIEYFNISFSFPKTSLSNLIRFSFSDFLIEEEFEPILLLKKLR